MFQRVIDAIRDRKVVLLCGAGTSFNSGLPIVYGTEQGSAGALRHVGLVNLLMHSLAATDYLIEAVQQSHVPFESIVADCASVVDIEPLLNIFDAKHVNSFHKLVARLLADGYVSTVVTTNFDRLIERAFDSERGGSGCQLTVHARPSTFAGIDLIQGGPQLIKLHGCVSEPRSVAATLPRVVGKEFSKEVHSLVARLFTLGADTTVLILGYSFSDVFDISPAIASAATGNATDVVVVEHSADGGSARSQPIRSKPAANPFEGFARGERLTCNTDVLIERLWDAVYGVQKPSVRVPPNWRTQVKDWADGVIKAGLENDILGAIYMKMGKHRTALDVLRVKPPTDPLAVLRRETSIANALHELGLYEACIAQCDIVLAKLGEVPRRTQALWRRRADALNTQGRSLQALGNMKRAKENYLEILRIHEENGAHATVAFVQSNLGSIDFRMGNAAQARRWFESAVAGAQRYGLVETLINALDGIGGIHSREPKQYAQALRYYRDALVLACQTGQLPKQAHVWCNIGELEIERGNWRDALKAFDAGLALGLDHHVVGIALQLGKARLLFSLKMPAKAEGPCEKALDAAQRLGEMDLLERSTSLLGSIHLQTDRVRSAIALFEEALRLASTTRSGYGVMFAHDRLGTAHGVAGNYDESVENFHAAIVWALRRRDLEVFSASLQGLGATYFQLRRVLRAFLLLPLILGVVGLQSLFTWWRKRAPA